MIRSVWLFISFHRPLEALTLRVLLSHPQGQGRKPPERDRKHVRLSVSAAIRGEYCSTRRDRMSSSIAACVSATEQGAWSTTEVNGRRHRTRRNSRRPR